MKTDDRGFYRIAGLGPGTYVINVPSVQASLPANIASSSSTTASWPSQTLEISAATRLVLGRYPMPQPEASGRLRIYAPAFFPGVTSMIDAQSISLKYGENRQGVDLRLQPVSTVQVSGIVTGPTEAVSGMPLRLVAVGSEELGDGSETATTRTSADGTFLFVNVPAGRYTVVARRAASELTVSNANVNGSGSLQLPRAPGMLHYSSMPSPGVDLVPQYRSAPGNSSYWGEVRAEVADQDVKGLVIPMQRGISIAGRGVIESPSPSAPNSNLTLPLLATAEPADGNIELGAPPTVIDVHGGAAFSPGGFTIDGVMRGQYFLRFELAPGVVKSVIWNGRDMTYTPFDVSEGHDFNDVVVTFTNRRVVLNGSVIDSGGQSARDAVVIAFPVERQQWTNYGFTLHLEAQEKCPIPKVNVREA